MIRMVIRRVKHDRVERLRRWMAELGGRRREVLESFAQEGVRHEQAYLVDTRDGMLLVYVMEAADHSDAARAFATSSLAIDREHKAVMRDVLADAPNAELLYDCAANSP